MAKNLSIKMSAVLFVKDKQVLLGYRKNTEAYENFWGTPGGRIEANEEPKEAAIRESKEEVDLTPVDLKGPAYTLDEYGVAGHFYLCTEWQGEPINVEPHKCRELKWFDIDDLPENIIPMTHKAFEFFGLRSY